MDIQEMHVWFRQYAQQMGMQNVRAILPEQIDVLINTSISDTINEIIRENLNLTNDRIITDNSKLGQINALRTLTAHKDLELDLSDRLPVLAEAYRISPFLKSTNNGTPNFPNMLYFVDLAVRYQLSTTTPTKYTSWYPVRIIDNMYLADTLQDYILKPRARSPIAVLYSMSPTSDNDDGLEIYFGDELATADGKLKSNGINLTNPTLRVNYLAKPAEVKFLSDIDATQNVDCNLPDYLHTDIVKHAVDLYRISVQGSLYANQQQQQNQQREVARNNVRPDNEGYTQ